ncbi:MAG: adenylate/guanylate cyclase protein [Devosia sp.]|nr:adenylate/guanylate cyclase protein [Devosia sp.]
MRPRRLVVSSLGLAMVIGLVLLRAADPFPVQAAREASFDLFQRIEPRAAGDFPVRIVDIDEASLAEIGQWPWPRDVFATLTDRLAALGAAVISYDVLFAEPDRLSPSRLAGNVATGGAPLADYDAILATALGQAPTVLGFARAPDAATLPSASKASFAISGEDPTAAIPQLGGAALPLPVLSEAAAGLGAISLHAVDSIGVVRRLPLIWASGATLYPSLALESLRVALGIGTVVVLGETAGAGFVEGLRIGDFTVPTTATGDLWLYYRRPDATLYISARDVLGANWQALAPRIAGQIVLVGASASGLNDLRGTPLGINVPGVSIHAQALEQIISGDFLVRADWVGGLEIVAAAIIGIGLVVVVQAAGPLFGIGFGLTMLAAVTGFSWFMFSDRGVLIDPGFPLFSTVMTYLGMVFLRFVTTDADKRKLRHAFAHYVAPSLLTEIENSGEQLKLGGEVRELTIMFADMRGFTAASESMGPAELVAMLNTLFGALGAEVTAEKGTIDKFIGDAIMAFWNAPVDVVAHPDKACRAALAMRAAVKRLNAENAFGPTHPAIGIGLATGDALVGNMGLETRFDYSCVGLSVNLASRVEGATKQIGYDIAVSEATRLGAPTLAFLEAGSVSLKGLSAPTPIHILVGDQTVAASAAFLALKARHEIAVTKLRAGKHATAELRSAVRLAAAVDPALLRFYDCIAERRFDFATEPLTVPA